MNSPKTLAPVVQTLDSAIHWINHYLLDNSIGFASVYPLDSDLSGGQRYPSFEQLGPGLCTDNEDGFQRNQSVTSEKVKHQRTALTKSLLRMNHSLAIGSFWR